jgi:plasmid replication initiation protein
VCTNIILAHTDTKGDTLMNPLEAMKAQENANKEILFIPKIMNLALSLLNSFIQNNNHFGLKLALLVASQKDKIDIKDDTIRFKVDELCKVLHTDRRYISSNLRALKKTIYRFVNDKGNVVETVPFHTTEYTKDNVYLYITMSKPALDLLLNLKTKEDKSGYQFTQAISNNLMRIDQRANKHTLRFQMLLEMINSFTTTKRKKFSLDELNGFFGTNYKRYAEMNRRVLVPVKQDIDISSSFTFEYEPTGDGKKITDVEIYIIENDNLFTISQ